MFTDLGDLENVTILLFLSFIIYVVLAFMTFVSVTRLSCIKANQLVI